MSQSALIKNFLQHSQISSHLETQLPQIHLKTVETLQSSPAGWHGSSDIQTLDGLGGNYLWSENPLQLARIGFRFDVGHVGSQGTYEIINGLTTIEQGTFYSVPNNPAIGWASITLVPSSTNLPRSFVVSGMVTDRHWKIEILLLNKLDNTGPVLPAFSAVRMP